MIDPTAKHGPRPLLLPPPPRVQRIIRAMEARGARCRLCNGPPAAVSVWFPPQPCRWRELWYALCRRCLRRPDVRQAAEDSLRQSLAAEANGQSL
jgi:hypothetical protein